MLALWSLSVNGASCALRCAGATRACATLTVARAPAAENDIAIAAAGGIPLLIGLLRSPAAGVQEAAAVALVNLSIFNGALPCAALRGCGAVGHVPRSPSRAPAAENRIAIAAAGGIPLLIGLLRSPVAGVHEVATCALWDISRNGSFASICSIADVVVLTQSGHMFARSRGEACHRRRWRCRRRRTPSRVARGGGPTRCRRLGGSTARVVGVRRDSS